MKKWQQRLLSWAVCAALLCACVGPLWLSPASAAAVDQRPAVLLADQLDQIAKDDYVYFGDYWQSSDGGGGFLKEPVRWQVLSTDLYQQRSAGGNPGNWGGVNGLFLFSEKGLDKATYNNGNTNYAVQWAGSDLYKFMTPGTINITNGYFTGKTGLAGTGAGAFYDALFSAEEKTAVLPTYITTQTNHPGVTPVVDAPTSFVFLLENEDMFNPDYFPGTDGTLENSAALALESRRRAHTGQGSQPGDQLGPGRRHAL